MPQVFTSKLFRGDVDDVNEFSQELRLEGKSKGLRWTAGLFDHSQDYKGGLDAGALGTLPCMFCRLSAPLLHGDREPLVRDRRPATLFVKFERKTDSSAVFGALEFDFTDRLRGRAEGRFTHEGKTQTTPIKDGRVIANARSFSDSWSFFTPRFTIDYRTPGDLLIYTSAAKGVKAGGFNENASVAAEESFKPEQNWTYEVGTKGSLLDGRVTFNAALFYVDWTSMQLPALSPSASVPQTVTLNVAGVVEGSRAFAERGAHTEPDRESGLLVYACPV